MPRSYAQLKRRLVGRPIPSFAESRERLGKPTALAVLASDAISSTAYASEEILRAHSASLLTKSAGPQDDKNARVWVHQQHRVRWQ